MKPTHTKQYIHYTSNHLHSTKQDIVTSLKNRALVICSSTNNWKRNMDSYQH
ncbi:hypothetical protein C0J52_06988 [Blattella germanica]|nr:hypothetical protein C0J52_06988 [Blattella germanica]